MADYVAGRDRRNAFIRRNLSDAGHPAVTGSEVANEFEYSLAVTVQFGLTDAGDARQFTGGARSSLGDRKQRRIGQDHESRLPLLFGLSGAPVTQQRQQIRVGVGRTAGASTELDCD